MNGLPLQCPCCAAESNHHSGHFRWVKTWKCKFRCNKTSKSSQQFFFCFILNIFPNVKIYQVHRQICILYNFLLSPCLFWNVLLQGSERAGIFEGLSWRHIRLTDHIYHMNRKTVNYEARMQNMVLMLSQYPFPKFDGSGFLWGEENWNLHSSERPDSWNMLRRNLFIQTQLLMMLLFSTML